MGLFGSDSGDVSEHLNCSPQGDHVTEKRVKKVEDVLDPDESVHYITSGSTVDVQKGGDNKSLFGDDRSRKSGTTGFVRAAFTDRRIVVKIPQVLGNDERTIPYDSIVSVDLDTGVMMKRLTLQTPGATYHIDADNPKKSEVREALRFVRDKAHSSAADTEATESSEPDPLEQIEQLKELHEQGALTDEEFEQKKRDLLDQV